MKKLKKTLVCLALLLCIVMSAVSCAEIFVTDGGNKTNQSQNGGNSSSQQFERENVDAINYNITVSNAELGKQDLETVIAEIRTSVVEIYSTVSNGTSSGSGVIISISEPNDDGNRHALIVTCQHVIDGAKSVVVRTVNGDNFNAAFVASNKKSDVGLISIEETEDLKFTALSTASFADTSTLGIGREVLAIGNPLGVLGGTVTRGIVSAIDRSVSVEGRKMTLIQTDAAINGGNSGGGLFDAETGVLVGVVNAGVESATAQGLSFAIPANTVTAIITQLLDKGYVEGDYDFGVELAVKYTRSQGRPSVFGYSYTYTYYVCIDSLDEFGTFYKAGLRANDIITSVKIANEETLTLDGTANQSVASQNLTKLQDYLLGVYKVGDKVELTYGRVNAGDIEYKNISFEIMQYVN